MGKEVGYESRAKEWRYPEDVPSTHMRKHNKPRRWTLRGVLTLARFGYPICEGEE